MINPRMEILKDSIKDKVKELLASRYAGYSITYNHYLAENVQKAQIASCKQEIEKHITNFISGSPDPSILRCYYINGNVNIGGLLDSLLQDTEADMEF